MLQASDDPARREAAAHLARMAIFSSLAPDELLRLAAACRTQSFVRGNILFHRGDPCHGFHLVLDGQVKLAFIAPDGNQKVVEIIRPGQSFGEAVMFMEKPYLVMAEALTDCRVLFIGKDAVFAELARAPQVARQIIAGLSQRLHHLIADVEAYSLRSGRERVVAYLLREEEIACPGAPAAGAVQFRLPAQKATIASRLNLTQEHFSRILHELAADGLIRVEGRLIHIPDLARLRAALPVL